jgi:hypothetical protein
MTNYVAKSTKFHAEYYDGTNGAAIVSYASTNGYPSGYLTESGGVLSLKMRPNSAISTAELARAGTFVMEVPANTTLLFELAASGAPGSLAYAIVVVDATALSNYWLELA